MKRLLFAVVVVGVVFGGVSFAQENDAPQMPEKVRKFLNRMNGTWNRDGELVGTFEHNWDHGDSALVGTGNMIVKELAMPIKFTHLYYWDGLSDNGVINTWSTSTSKGFANGITRGKLLSEAIMVGETTSVRHGGTKVSSNVRIEFVSPDRYTWKETNLIVAGVKEPDTTDVITRVKPTTRADFEEFCRLAEGRWMTETTLTEDWPGFGKKGETLNCYLQFTRSANGNALLGEHSFGKGWINEFKFYDPVAGAVISTRTMSDGSIGYLRERKSRGEWLAECTEISPAGTKSEWEAVLIFGETKKTWIHQMGSPGEDKDKWGEDVWHRLSK